MEAKKLFAVVLTLLVLVNTINAIQMREYDVYLNAEKGVIGYTYTSTGENIMFGKMLPPGMHNQKQAYRVDMQNEKKTQKEITAIFYYKGNAQLLDSEGEKLQENIAIKDGKIYVYYFFPKDENYKFYIVGDGELTGVTLSYGKTLPKEEQISSSKQTANDYQKQDSSSNIEKPKTEYKTETGQNQNIEINNNDLLVFAIPVILFVIIIGIAIKMSKPKDSEETKHKIFKPGSKIELEE